MKTMTDSKEEAYYDRNQAVMALAKIAEQQGYKVGIQENPEDPEWPILMIDLPTGQVGWHIPKGQLTGAWLAYEKDWDQHTLDEKQNRMTDFIEERYQIKKTIQKTP